MKNPWMSMWLSAANTWSSAARGQMAAGAKRAQNEMASEVSRQAMALWFPAAALKPAPKRVRRAKR